MFSHRYYLDYVATFFLKIYLSQPKSAALLFINQLNNCQYLYRGGCRILKRGALYIMHGGGGGEGGRKDTKHCNSNVMYSYSIMKNKITNTYRYVKHQLNCSFCWL